MSNGVIIDGFIAVDKFVSLESIEYFFLTHAHSDHYGGLNHKWRRGQICCSPLTAKLLPEITRIRSPNGKGVDVRCIRPLEMHKRHEMNGFSVTLISANHVPGSVMFIFEGKRIKGGPVLYTGDFRADCAFYRCETAINILQMYNFGKIFLDTTYINAECQEFPSRTFSFLRTLDIVRELLISGASVIFSLCGLGREMFLVELSKNLSQKIRQDKVRMAVAKVLDMEQYFTESDENARISTCSKADQMKVLADPKAHIIELSMLSHLKPTASLIHERIHRIAYSDHCSPSEIRDFLSYLTFAEVIGIPEGLAAAQIQALKLLGAPSINAPSTSESVTLPFTKSELESIDSGSKDHVFRANLDAEWKQAKNEVNEKQNEAGDENTSQKADYWSEVNAVLQQLTEMAVKGDFVESSTSTLRGCLDRALEECSFNAGLRRLADEGKLEAYMEMNAKAPPITAAKIDLTSFMKFDTTVSLPESSPMMQRAMDLIVEFMEQSESAEAGQSGVLPSS